MTVIADKLTEALEISKNDINNFVWKGPKKIIAGKRVQEEIKLMDATPEQLREFYAHCDSMLNSKDKENPGRYVLINQIKDQINRCNAELYMRSLRNPEDGSEPIPTHVFYQKLEELLNHPTYLEQIPKSEYSKTPISKAIFIDSNFGNIPISIVREACLDVLGIFRKKHITLNFILKMGLWFTKQEIDEYLTSDKLSKLDMMRQNLHLKPEMKLWVNPNGGLSYTEFRAMYNLRDCRYSDMSSAQLTTLRNKILFRLEDEARTHAQLWEDKIEQIKKVCEKRGISTDFISAGNKN